jgi:hypothetical protein
MKLLLSSRSFSSWEESGAVAKNGQLYYSPNSESKSHGILCTSEQLDKSYVPPMSAKEQSEFRAAFEKVTDRLAAVEKQLAATRTPLKIRDASPAA